MTGDGNEDGILVVGHPYGPEGLGASRSGGDLPIGAGLAVGDGTQGLPHPLLKGGALQDIGEVEGPPPALQVFADLLKDQVGEGGPPLLPDGLLRPGEAGDCPVLIFYEQLPEGEGVYGIAVHRYLLLLRQMPIFSAS